MICFIFELSYQFGDHPDFFRYYLKMPSCVFPCCPMFSYFRAQAILCIASSLKNIEQILIFEIIMHL